MEAVPGTQTALSQEEFFEQVKQIGISVIGQSGKHRVRRQKIYALPDMTATVGCIPLIASSIMSKADVRFGRHFADVTMGDGAFMKDLDRALELARLMVSIGTPHGRNVAALITDMDKPLGKNIGNASRSSRAWMCSRGSGTADL